MQISGALTGGVYGVTEQEIVGIVNEVFEEYFEIERERLLPEANIFEDLELDSLDIVDLVVAMQEKFKVRIRDDERIRSIRTLGDVYRFVLTLESEGVTPGA
jgi:acyl carrier protein